MEYYYHITDQVWPDKVLLSPRRVGKNRSPWESNQPRICVCGTPWHCLVSIPHTNSKLFVFRTLEKINPINPEGILDAHVTGEKWIIEPTTFIKVTEIDVDVVQEFGLLPVVGTVWAIDRQRVLLERVKRIFNSWYGERHENNIQAEQVGQDCDFVWGHDAGTSSCVV
jgi:hypothetical protein